VPFQAIKIGSKVRSLTEKRVLQHGAAYDGYLLQYVCVFGLHANQRKPVAQLKAAFTQMRMLWP
jgi:hypothetical protein